MQAKGKGAHDSNTESLQTTDESLQMPKLTRKNCNIGKKQTYQYKVPEVLYKNPKQQQTHQNSSKQQSMYHTSELHELPLPCKVCVSDKVARLFKQKIFLYMAKTKTKGKTRQ